MKTTNQTSIVSIILKYLLQLISVALFYGALLYLTAAFWLPFLNHKLSHITYLPVPNFNEQVTIMLIIYSLFCYFANNFVLNLYRKGRVPQLIYSIIADMLVLPLGLALSLDYNNIHAKSKFEFNTAIYNIYIISALLIIKEIIAMRLLSDKKQPAKKMNYKTR